MRREYCRVCGNEYNRDIKHIKGIGLVCSACRMCHGYCSHQLPVKWIGQDGFGGDSRLCSHCDREASKKRQARKRVARRPKNQRDRRALGTIIKLSKTDFKLWKYFRLETVHDEMAEFRYIEIGYFKTPGEHNTLILNIGCGNVFGGKTICYSSRQVEIEFSHQIHYENYFKIFTRRIRRLAPYRVVFVRERGRKGTVGHWDSRLWSEQWAKTKNTIIEKALPITYKRRLMKLAEKNMEGNARTRELERIFDTTVPEYVDGHGLMPDAKEDKV